MLASLLERLDGIVEAAGESVTTPKELCRAREGRDVNRGCWFLTPRRIGLETIVLVPLFLCIGLVLVRKWTLAARKSCDAAPPLWLRAFTVLHLALSWFYKLQRPLGIIFMLMPCMVCTAFVCVSACAPTAYLRSLAHQAVLTLLGLTLQVFLTPDTSGLDQPFEVPFFWLQHVIILVWPLWAICAGHLPARDHGLAASFGIGNVLIAFYVGPATFIGLRFDFNVNYMLHPHKAFVALGDNYRIASIVGLEVLFLIGRSIGMALERAWFGDAAKAKKP